MDAQLARDVAIPAEPLPLNYNDGFRDWTNLEKEVRWRHGYSLRPMRVYPRQQVPGTSFSPGTLADGRPCTFRIST